MTLPFKKAMTLTLLILLTCGNHTFAYSDKPLISYRELRYKDLFGQSSWWSCGPATVATLLYSFYQIPITELDVIQLVEAISEDNNYLTEGISFLLIKRLLESFKIESIGYKVEPISLIEYFADNGLPLILYFTLLKKHYVLCIGNINSKELLIADPSFGYLTISINSLVKQKGFNGVVMLTIPPTEQDFRNLKHVQNQMLERYHERYLYLRTLK